MVQYILILVLSFSYGGQTITEAEFNSEEACVAAGEMAKEKLKIWRGSDVRYICAKK